MFGQLSYGSSSRSELPCEDISPSLDKPIGFCNLDENSMLDIWVDNANVLTITPLLVLLVVETQAKVKISDVQCRWDVNTVGASWIHHEVGKGNEFLNYHRITMHISGIWKRLGYLFVCQCDHLHFISIRPIASTGVLWTVRVCNCSLMLWFNVCDRHRLWT